MKMTKAEQERRVKVCRDAGHRPVRTWGVAHCSYCGVGLPTASVPSPDPEEPETPTDPIDPPEAKETPREALRGHPAGQTGRRKCPHSNKRIAYAILRRDGHIDAYDAVYEVRCPFCGTVRRNTRLAATIWELRHKEHLSIRTDTLPGMLASYVLEETA